MIDRTSSRSGKPRRCGACREQVTTGGAFDCPRCGAAVHVSCAWDAPCCARCGESLSIEVAHFARRQTDTRWQRLLALLRDLRAQPLAVLAQAHSDQGRWMGYPVMMFFIGIGLAIALTLLGAYVAHRA
jgi:hypothetical protein